MIPTAPNLSMTAPSYAKAALIRFGMKLVTLGSAGKVYFNKQFRLCGKELLEHADHTHGCATAATNHGQNRIRDWLAGHLKSSGQFMRDYEAEVRLRSDMAAIPEAGGHPISKDVVASSPFTTGTHRQAEGERRGRTVQQAEEEKPKQYRSPQGRAAVHLGPLAVDVHGRSGGLVDQALSEAGTRIMAKRDALVAARSERAPGTLQNGWRAQGTVEVQLRNIEVYRDCLAGNSCDDQDPEGEVSDLVVVVAGVQWGSKREVVRYRLPSAEDTDTDTSCRLFCGTYFVTTPAVESCVSGNPCHAVAPSPHAI